MPIRRRLVASVEVGMPGTAEIINALHALDNKIATQIADFYKDLRSVEKSFIPREELDRRFERMNESHEKRFDDIKRALDGISDRLSGDLKQSIAKIALDHSEQLGAYSQQMEDVKIRLTSVEGDNAIQRALILSKEQTLIESRKAFERRNNLILGAFMALMTLVTTVVAVSEYNHSTFNTHLIDKVR